MEHSKPAEDRDEDIADGANLSTLVDVNCDKKKGSVITIIGLLLKINYDEKKELHFMVEK